MRCTVTSFLSIAWLVVASTQGAAEDHLVHSWKRLQLSDAFYAEGASFGDLNRDGQSDVIAGPFWYEGPSFSTRHELFSPKPFDRNGYSDNFFIWVRDFNADGWNDVLVLGFPGKEASWLENPRGTESHWTRHVVFESGLDNESPTFLDLNGDGREEIVFSFQGQFGWAGPGPEGPDKPWPFHPITPKGDYAAFTHGMGVGDVNQDGRLDLIERTGWWEQPTRESRELWAKHVYDFAPGGYGGAQLYAYAYDFDGDGLNDVLAGPQAHGFGLNVFKGRRKDGQVTFEIQRILGSTPEENDYGVVFSEVHAVDLVDMDGDGLKDIVTGKRYWSHSAAERHSRGPRVLYWLKTVRAPYGLDFIPFLIDGSSGVGVQVVAGDLNGDRLPDVVVSNKAGTFVQIHEARKVERAEWEASFPRPWPSVADARKSRVDGAAVDGAAAASKSPGDGSDIYPNAGMKGEDAAKAMTLPPGFKATLFADEPDVVQPIAMTLDDRGRLWVAEAYSYPQRQPDDKARDRILIFEDENGDGKFDTRKVFAEKLNLVSGLEVGFGGAWIGAAPQLLFIPDANGDDVPDGPPQVLLDGWGYQDTHETLNAFNWGPDGWLYGCHGVFTHSKVGKPGDPDEKRQGVNAAIWRYHPTKHTFEVFCHGTSNPWGVDWDDWGQAFLTSCVIPHLYQVIQGARYERQGGQHFNPYTYDDIKTIADHRHYLGQNPHGGNNRSDSAGGGHAHCGAMVYLGDTWPQSYRNQIFMHNVHGQRVNVDLLVQKGSGYVGLHSPDFLLSNDRWSQMLYFRTGPDGNVYMNDWYDKQACHTGNPADHDRSNGRIFKISYGDAKPVKVDLAKLSDKELADLQAHANDYFVRHARRLLQERASKGTISDEAKNALKKIAFENTEETRRLRGLWALHATGDLTEADALVALKNYSAFVRAWAIQLTMESRSASPALLAVFAEMARKDASPAVRLYLASACDRMERKDRWTILEGLVAHAEDAQDQNLPLMYWYAAEPLAEEDAERAIALAVGSKVPPLADFMARRIASKGTPEAIALLVKTLSEIQDPTARIAFAKALNESFKGRRGLVMPPNWPQARDALAKSSDEGLNAQLTALAVRFGDPVALAGMRAALSDPEADLAERAGALKGLVEARDKDLPQVLQSILRGGSAKDAALRSDVIRALATYSDPATPRAVLDIYSSLGGPERRDAIGTLAARSEYARALLAEVAARKVPATDVPAEIIRQLKNLKDAEVDKHIGEIWGSARETAEDKKKLIDHYKRLVKSAKGPPDSSLGRAAFAKTCQQCHTLFGVGGKVGPELTGSNRADLDYLLSNVLDPSAVMAREYMPKVFVTKDGRVVTAIVKAEEKSTYTVVTQNETIVLAKDDIQEAQESQRSMMPEDLLKPLNDVEVRGLVAYLASASQIPLLATQENVKDFFNGRDLASWYGNMDLWKVEGGEIVGKSPGLKHNEFLKSELLVSDFRLKLKVKLTPNEENSGVQIRSEPLPDGEMRGYQADIGKGWWGKLYEESGRGLLWDKSGEAHVKVGEWNDYEVEALGSRVRTWINGQPCVDLEDPKGALRGIIAVQIHAGGPMEVRFKDLKLDVLAGR